MEVTIDINDSVPLSTQLVGQIKKAVLCGEICPGDALPSIRQLANDLVLNNKTVAKAYRLLERDSVTQTKGSRGTFIHGHAIPRLDLEVDNARKTRELEEARDLQLSLLPRELPSCPEFEVAAAMITATEVGGDYYDFDVDDSGGFTVAVGDAVGHGARAGALVAATKGMFCLGSGGRAVEVMLERFDEAFRRMQMKRASVALLLAHFRGPRLAVASAGMPPPLLYRASSGQVEEVPVTGTPLGSPLTTGRTACHVDLEPNDTVLLMSDGFPELVVKNGEPFGYESARAAFGEICGSSADEVVRHLESTVQQTARDAPDDDVTFVVVRCRAQLV